MRKLTSYQTFEYEKAELRIKDERIFLFENEHTLKTYFSVWRIIDVSTLNDTFIAISFDNGMRLILNLIKVETKKKIMIAVEELLAKKKRYFSTIPFTIMDFKDVGNSMSFLFTLYKERKFPMPKPKIWDRKQPTYVEELSIFRFETAKKKPAEAMSPTKVKRRRSTQALLKLDLDAMLELDQKLEADKILQSAYITSNAKSQTTLIEKEAIAEENEDGEALIEIEEFDENKVAEDENEQLADKRMEELELSGDLDMKTMAQTVVEIEEAQDPKTQSQPPSTNVIAMVDKRSKSLTKQKGEKLNLSADKKKKK